MVDTKTENYEKVDGSYEKFDSSKDVVVKIFQTEPTEVLPIDSNSIKLSSDDKVATVDDVVHEPSTNDVIKGLMASQDDARINKFLQLIAPNAIEGGSNKKDENFDVKENLKFVTEKVGEVDSNGLQTDEHQDKKDDKEDYDNLQSGSYEINDELNDSGLHGTHGKNKSSIENSETGKRIESRDEKISLGNITEDSVASDPQMNSRNKVDVGSYQRNSDELLSGNLHEYLRLHDNYVKLN